MEFLQHLPKRLKNNGLGALCLFGSRPSDDELPEIASLRSLKVALESLKEVPCWFAVFNRLFRVLIKIIISSVSCLFGVCLTSG